MAMSSKRDEYAERLKQQIDEWNRLLDRWEQEAKSRSAEARQEAERRLHDLRRRRDDLRERLPEIQEAGEKAFDELLDGINRAWKELSRAFDRSRSDFDDDDAIRQVGAGDSTAGSTGTDAGGAGGTGPEGGGPEGDDESPGANGVR